MLKFIALATLLISFASPLRAADTAGADEMQWVAIRAKDKHARTAVVNAGVSIESVVQDMSYGFGTKRMIQALEKKGFEVVSYFAASEIRTNDFPVKDAAYHNYEELNAELDSLLALFPNLLHDFSLGRTVEGRFIRGMRLNPHATDGTTPSSLPGAFFVGGHHAREHLSIEVPLLMLKHLVENYGTDPTITRLVDTRDIFFVPVLNVDGSEFDISTGSYKMWRKNRANATARCAGVDLNRNYGYGWGTGGSSTDACSDVYMGPQAFSEPETRAVKAFVEGHPNLKVLLSFHTYSELVLYPWGGSNDPVPNVADFNTFKKMAETMAGWNRYTPEQASDLYIASGDTTDWAYGTLGIFAFTFELSPADAWGGGGFYPGVGAIQSTFQANVRPVLYMIDLADNPHRAVTMPQTTLFYGQP